MNYPQQCKKKKKKDCELVQSLHRLSNDLCPFPQLTVLVFKLKIQKTIYLNRIYNKNCNYGNSSNNNIS